MLSPATIPAPHHRTSPPGSSRVWRLATLGLCALLGAIATHGFGLEDWKLMRDIVPQQYLCHRVSSAMVIDGRLDDPAWAAIPWTSDFVDIEGDRKPRPRFRTRAKMAWDKDYFYVAAEMQEPHVWGTITQRDAVIFQDNDFEVFIDPDGDCHEYYEFEMNALNTGWDLFLAKPYKDGGKAVDAWNILGIKTAVHVQGTLNNPSDTDTGWSIEIAFPWKALGEYARRPAPPRESDRWRIGFSRVEWQVDVVDGKYVKRPGLREDNWIWSAQGVIDMHRPEQWGVVQFTSKPPGSATAIPEPDWAARRWLQEIYYRQRDFNTANKRWATSLEELGMAAVQPPTLVASTTLKPAKEGWTATAHLKREGVKRSWSIRHDAHVSSK